MTVVAFTVHGKPEPKGSKTRTRWGVREDNPNAKAYMKHVADVAAEAMDGRALLEGPLILLATFYRPRPAGHFTSKRELSAEGRRMPAPTTKPDGLKLTRGVEDALTGVVFRDDAQIVVGFWRKEYGEPARAEVTVANLDDVIVSVK